MPKVNNFEICEKYERYMIFTHHGNGTMGGYHVGLEAVYYHTDSEVAARRKFYGLTNDFCDVKLFDRVEGIVILNHEE